MNVDELAVVPAHRPRRDLLRAVHPQGRLPRELRAHQPGLARVAEEARAGEDRRWRRPSRPSPARRTRRARSPSTCPTSSTSSSTPATPATPLGATIGQSLPNWGPVANEGRGRTVAMTQPLHRQGQRRRGCMEQAGVAVLQGDAWPVTFDPKPGRHVHRAPRGGAQPRPRPRVQGGRARPTIRSFGGPLASHDGGAEGPDRRAVLRRLAGGEGHRRPGAAAERTHVRDVTWAFGHIAAGHVRPPRTSPRPTASSRPSRWARW